MSCIVSFTYAEKARVIVKGPRPKGQVPWTASAWFVLADGKKHTHSVTVPPVTVVELVPAIGQLIDSLIEDVGNQVTAAGWVASTHGCKRR